MHLYIYLCKRQKSVFSYYFAKNFKWGIRFALLMKYINTLYRQPFASTPGAELSENRSATTACFDLVEYKYFHLYSRYVFRVLETVGYLINSHVLIGEMRYLRIKIDQSQNATFHTSVKLPHDWPQDSFFPKNSYKNILLVTTTLSCNIFHGFFINVSDIVAQAISMAKKTECEYGERSLSLKSFFRLKGEF